MLGFTDLLKLPVDRAHSYPCFTDRFTPRCAEVGRLA